MAGFGGVLKKWRQIRRLSQMELALSAGVSPRHLSFLETGRAQPSRGMVLRLSEELQVPAAARNQLLTAAGLAPAYVRRDLNDDELAPLRQAAARMLERHEPYPAMLMDRHWQLVDMNRAAALMLGSAGITRGSSLIEALLGNAALRAALDNLEEVERHSLARLRTELAHCGADPVLEQAIARLQRSAAEPGGADDGVLPAVIPARYRMGGQVLSFFSTITQFGGTGDLAMSDLRIEMLFPADEATRGRLEAMAGPGGETGAGG
ncbi:helix-turn-helix transcriptional regulator [Leisingera aquaemixtae]|uniref:helix-turn-helix domain-containing protein n=1 Tax=Leisingera aquaemixtae TaxID=1396826 RepID=UPI0021A421A9|nr:helix-turn-helix transcriptional regulator [Leisingera aquaemixtae]UWQ26404.1 helix-turn-helix transcriptional regulator [Leisingera aquaemixtae]UWQ47366.1 helix-turn-helix transcriptional regulator [Leisingera aquaemixtae]